MFNIFNSIVVKIDSAFILFSYLEFGVPYGKSERSWCKRWSQRVQSEYHFHLFIQYLFSSVSVILTTDGLGLLCSVIRFDKSNKSQPFFYYSSNECDKFISTNWILNWWKTARCVHFMGFNSFAFSYYCSLFISNLPIVWFTFFSNL